MSDWKERPLGELTENFDSIRIPVKEADRIVGPYPYYGASGVVDHVDKYLFDGDYLLIAEDGENLRTRNTPIAFIAHGKFWVNNHAHVVRGNRETDTRYLMYALAATEISGYLTGSTMPKLTQSNMNRIPVIAPPLKVQQAIARVLGVLDDKIELDRRMNETREAMARAIFKSWFVDFDPVRAKAAGRQPAGLSPELAALFPDSFEDSEVGEIPAGWEVRTIGEVVEFAYGKALTASNRVPGNVPVFGSNGVVGWHNEALVTGPGIVIGRKGNPGIVTWSAREFFPIDTTFYARTIGSSQSLHYLFFCLHNQGLSRLTADSAVPGLNRHMAYMNNMLVPSAAILAAFDEQVVPLFDRIDTNGKASRTLANLRDTLLPKLISGELRVPDAIRCLEAMQA